MATPEQIQHLRENLVSFVAHTGEQDVEQYFADHEDKYPDLYWRVCADIGLEPISPPPVAAPGLVIHDESGGEVDAASAIAAVTGGMSEEEIAELRARFQQEQSQGSTGTHTVDGPTIDDEYGIEVNAEVVDAVLAATDPRDSDIALKFLDFLQKTGRLAVIGTLAGGAGYMFVYQEPKGTSRAGYSPGATAGGRMVDQALEKAQAGGHRRGKSGLCVHCISAIEERDGVAVLMEAGDDGDPSACPKNAGGHEFA